MRTTHRRIAIACALAATVAGVPAAAMAASQTSNRTAAAAAPVPKGFVGNSMSWISPSRGWVLGTESCGGKPPTNCATSQVIATTNGGANWHLVGTIHAAIPKLGNAGKGITEIRMATAEIGWAYGPNLYRTSDGGRTWHAMPIPGHGKQLLSLAVAGKATYAIASTCGFNQGLCGKLTAWRTGLGRTLWRELPAALHANVAANIAAYGRTVYIVNPMVSLGRPTQVLASTDIGKHFSARPNPCTSAEENTMIQAAPYSATKVAFLCDGNPGFSKAVKAVYRSVNTGRTDTYAGTMGLYGIQAELAVSPSGHLAVASWSDGSFIYINDKAGTTWYMVVGSGDGGAGFNDITFLTNHVAWVVGAPADMFPGIGVPVVSRDAGRTWKVGKF